MTGFTKPTREKDIKREWHFFDAKGRVLGRLATEIAPFLRGKQKPYFSANLDCGDYVVVINAREIKITGKKEKQKIYTHYTGYPGGLKKKSLGEMRKEKPEEIIIHAVSGMLPKNKLRDRFLTRLFVFSGSEHSYKDKFKRET